MKNLRLVCCTWLLSGALVALASSVVSAAVDTLGVPIEGAIAVTATASPNDTTPQAVFCGGAPLALVAEGHGNGFTTLGPLTFSLQKTLDVPGLMHGCVVLTMPNGDTLTAVYDATEGVPNANGFIVATGTWTFTGGTGGFLDASGQAAFSAVFIGLYPANSFIGGAQAPLQVSAYYTFRGRLVLHQPE